MSSVPWIGKAGTNVYHAVKTNQFGLIRLSDLAERASNRTNRNGALLNDDHWGLFSTERREIADFIKANRIRGLCILHGDSHMLAADDGRHSDYATGGGVRIPVMCAGPLDQSHRSKERQRSVYRMSKGEGGLAHDHG
jgi:phosphodiesterase/alkaline phosphatase D-like protein